MTLSDLLVDAAEQLDDVETDSAPDGAITWSRGKRGFARLASDGAAAEFALDPAVAAAAVRTPDTVPSARGSGWVSFSPVVLDDHAADRAIAWFESAYRRIGPRH